MKYNDLKKLFAAILLVAVGCCLAVGCGSGWQEEEKQLIESQAMVMYVLSIDNPRENEILRRKSEGVTGAMISDRTYPMLAAKMLATVQAPEYDGVGIAAPQVGISRRIVAVMRYDKDGKPFEVYPDIRITSFNGEMVPGPEGCLSVPGLRGQVDRYQDIEIRYTNPVTLRDTTERVTGYTAVIFQHECDHLDGIVYVDKASEITDISE